jgi:SAM-dependent methyltransferase
MEHYDEYLERVNWEPSNGLHLWVAKRLMKSFAFHAKFEFKSSLSFLEIGVGTGRIATALKNLGIGEFVGVEPNSRLAEYSRHRGFDVREFELPNLLKEWQDSFDAVASFHVLEHAPTYIDARLWVKEMIRVTKPGGKILVAAPDIRITKELFWDSDWSHGFPTTPRRVAQIGDDLGLKTIYAGNFAIGTTNVFISILAKFINRLIPTRIVDSLTMRIVNRPLASGMKIALFWGLTFVVFEKPSN